jgi:methylmalonyl-CoA mutase N-terminal domain/subunit
MKDRLGVTNDKALLCRFHVQTGGSTLTATQIDNNVVRTTIQALSAVLGGSQSLHTNSRDEALALPTDEAVKLALRTQQIIAHESGITDYPDPFGGSYVVEEMTDNLVNGALRIIAEIDNLGGAISAIEKGWIQNEISHSAYEYQKDIDSKKQIIVGVNQFEDTEEIDPELLEIDPEKVNAQIESVTSLKSSRNNDQVNQQLGRLKTVAESNHNVMPSIIDCVKNDCTLGEIANTFRSVFGEHQSQ